jgi:hypothetical protein
MEDDTRKELKRLSGKRNQIIWKIAKTGDLSSLSPEDRKLAETMLEHEEYHNQFEMADVLSEHEYDPDREINPFLHIALHGVVETQLENRDPLEVYQFYNAMRKKKTSHHDALHLIGAVLAPLLFGTLKDLKPFDLEDYRSRLRKFKSMKPEKIFESLEREEDPLDG